MCIKNFVWIVLFSVFISCKQSDTTESIKDEMILKLNDSLNIPTDNTAVVFISPNSKCLYCDKKLYDFTVNAQSHKNIYIISTFEKNRLFENDFKIKTIYEDKYYQIFSKHFSEFSRLVILKNNTVQDVYLITPKNTDSIIHYIQENFK